MLWLIIKHFAELLTVKLNGVMVSGLIYNLTTSANKVVVSRSSKVTWGKKLHGVK